MQDLLDTLEKVNQLALTQDEKASVQAYFERVAQDLPSFAEVDTQNVTPMVYVMPLSNVLREDESSQPFTRDDLQKGAPEAEDGYWEVPRLIE
ncbi:MAG: Asp-tRNA(Asn)/Glu-tRNA(Gln) amidotransferase subunit GatC [Clostridia bacterium]|nr:Asp-tRNA(Asn)/Glu-tRNA(Gln) amidotransferase subunit GatC [Clostridia bacterium]